MGATHNQRVGVCNRRSGYRPDFWPASHGTFVGTLGVLDMSLALHMDATGASDCLRPEDKDLYIQCLQWLMDNWQNPSSMYDRAVQTLVHRTLAEQRSKDRGPLGPPDLICTRPSH